MPSNVQLQFTARGQIVKLNLTRSMAVNDVGANDSLPVLIGERGRIQRWNVSKSLQVRLFTIGYLNITSIVRQMAPRDYYLRIVKLIKLKNLLPEICFDQVIEKPAPWCTAMIQAYWPYSLFKYTCWPATIING